MNCRPISRFTFLTEDGVDGVHGSLVHGRVADETACVSEGDAGWRGMVALIVGDDLDAIVQRAPHGHASVGRPEVDADRRAVALRNHLHATEVVLQRR